MQVAKNITKAEITAVKILADGTKVPLGTVAYYHRNPLRRLWWRVKQAFHTRPDLRK